MNYFTRGEANTTFRMKSLHPVKKITFQVGTENTETPPYSATLPASICQANTLFSSPPPPKSNFCTDEHIVHWIMSTLCKVDLLADCKRVTWSAGTHTHTHTHTHKHTHTYGDRPHMHDLLRPIRAAIERDVDLFSGVE